LRPSRDPTDPVRVVNVDAADESEVDYAPLRHSRALEDSSPDLLQTKIAIIGSIVGTGREN